MPSSPSVNDYAAIAQNCYKSAAQANHLGEWTCHRRQYGNQPESNIGATGLSPALQAGFGAALYRKNEIAIVGFAGSDDLVEDWMTSDVRILEGNLPILQIADAVHFFQWAIKECGPENTSITGHSLGGAIAFIVAQVYKGTQCVTFNAPGMAEAKGSFTPKNIDGSNTYNFRANGDPVSQWGKHAGKLWSVSVSATLDFATLGSRNILMQLGARGWQHKMGPLAEAIRKSSHGDLPPKLWDKAVLRLR